MSFKIDVDVIPGEGIQGQYSPRQSCGNQVHDNILKQNKAHSTPYLLSSNRALGLSITDCDDENEPPIGHHINCSRLSIASSEKLSLSTSSLQVPPLEINVKGAEELHRDLSKSAPTSPFMTNEISRWKSISNECKRDESEQQEHHGTVSDKINTHDQLTSSSASDQFSLKSLTLRDHLASSLSSDQLSIISRPRSPMVSARGWRPVEPGYNSQGNSVVIQRTVQIGGPESSSLTDTIPAMPYGLAVICTVLNFIIPGTGTLLSGMSVICCSKTRKENSLTDVLWFNSVTAIGQFILAPIFFLGWFWSIRWAILFISISETEYKSLCDKDQPDTQSIDTRQQIYRPHQEPPVACQTTTTTTTVSMPEAGTSQDPIQPIIVLQEAPVYVQSDKLPDIRASLPRRPRGLNPNNPRHQRILRQQQTFYEDEVPPGLLDAEALEDIVIRNGATEK